MLEILTIHFKAIPVWKCSRQTPIMMVFTTINSSNTNLTLTKSIKLQLPTRTTLWEVNIYNKRTTYRSPNTYLWADQMNSNCNRAHTFKMETSRSMIGAVVARNFWWTIGQELQASSWSMIDQLRAVSLWLTIEVMVQIDLPSTTYILLLALSLWLTTEVVEAVHTKFVEATLLNRTSFKLMTDPEDHLTSKWMTKDQLVRKPLTSENEVLVR